VPEIVETERLKSYSPAADAPKTLSDSADRVPGRSGFARPARVLMVESNEDGTVGGSHQALYDLALRIDHRDFEPVALFNQDNVFVNKLRARGIEVVVFDGVVGYERERNRNGWRAGKLLRSSQAVLRRRRELKRLNVDLLHLNNSPGVGSDDWLPAARLAGIPCVVTAMGDAGRPRGTVHRWLYRKFDVYLAISHYMAAILRKHGVDSQRIELVYLGVDFENLRARLTRSTEAVRAELNVRPGQLLALMVGNIRAWKGQREVIAAVRLLPRDIQRRLRVCFAGATAPVDAAYAADLRDEIARGGLEDCITFLGPRSDVADLYSAADIALHASTTPEPFGLVVPEAMSLKCAVIAASSGGPAEVITPGTGFLCNPSQPGEYAAALEQLVRDESLRRAIAEAGPARAALFSIERTVEGTERVYRRALANFARSASGERAVSSRS
jgi:glycosyltransferase involved in cell wall biosynthesis